jgi:hypothetical protein
MVRPGKANRSATLKNYRVILAKLQLPDGAGLRARLGNAARGGRPTEGQVAVKQVIIRILGAVPSPPPGGL